MHSLEGKRALVCGSSRGIGRACAIEFARLGARVTLLARTEALLREVRDSLPGPGGGPPPDPGHEWLCADSADPDRIAAAVREHVDRTGPFQILLNNTGGPPGGPILEADPALFRDFFSRHVVTNQMLAQTLVPGMKETGYGRILNIISTSVKEPLRGLGVSNTIRGAVASWSKTLARELAPFGITVNNILPGATRTERLVSIIKDRAKRAGTGEGEIERGMLAEIPFGRFGMPEEIAAAAGFLASPTASYITGINLPVDGGRTSSL
jgi:3-oxoacyl-[acyl-carrier protein] reductase